MPRLKLPTLREFKAHDPYNCLICQANTKTHQAVPRHRDPGTANPSSYTGRHRVRGHRR